VSENQDTKTVLGPDCKIKGKLQLDSDATIMGEFHGQIRVGGMLELTESSRVKGTVVAGGLRLGGKAQADVVAEHGMELLATAQLHGHLYTSRLSVVDGAMFEGHVVVGPKAMEAAGELIKQVGNDSDESDTPPARKNGTPAPALARTPSNGQSHQEQDDAPDVNTVPRSLDEILHRRRAKMAIAGNGAGQDNE